MSNTVKFKAGETIITEGARADKAYMVLSGCVRVFLEKEEKIVDLAELPIGSVFGESALFGDNEYGANIAAKDDTELLVITPEKFQEKLDDCDPMIQEIIRMLIERQRQTNEALLNRETQEFMDIDFVDT